MAASLQLITGIGPAAAGLLANNGYPSAEALADASVEELTELPGFGPARAQQIINDAKALIAEQQAETEPDVEEDTAQTAEPQTESVDTDFAEEEQEYEAIDDSDAPVLEESLYHLESDDLEEEPEQTPDSSSNSSKKKKQKKNKKADKKGKKQKDKKEKGKTSKKEKTAKKSKKASKKDNKAGKKSKKSKKKQ